MKAMGIYEDIENLWGVGGDVKLKEMQSDHLNVEMITDSKSEK